MSALDKTFVYSINDIEIEFPKLKMSDFVSLFEVVRIQKKAKADTAKKNGLLNDSQHQSMLLAILDANDNVFEVASMYGSPVIARKMVDASWKKTGKPIAELDTLLDDVDPQSVCEIAYGVSNRTITKKKIEEKDEKKNTIE